MKFQRHQIILAGLLGLTLMGMLVGWYLIQPIAIEKCSPDLRYSSGVNHYCANSPLVDSAGLPLQAIWPLLLVFFALMFVRKEIFSWWWKIVLPFALLLLWWVISTPPFSHGFGLPESRAINTRLASIAFLLLSILIIAVTYLGYWLRAKWSLRKKPSV